MHRIHFETEHNMFRESFRAFLQKEVLPHQDAWEAAGVVSPPEHNGDRSVLAPPPAR